MGGVLQEGNRLWSPGRESELRPIDRRVDAYRTKRRGTALVCQVQTEASGTRRTLHIVRRCVFWPLRVVGGNAMLGFVAQLVPLLNLTGCGRTGHYGRGGGSETPPLRALSPGGFPSMRVMRRYRLRSLH